MSNSVNFFVKCLKLFVIILKKKKILYSAHVPCSLRNLRIHITWHLQKRLLRGRNRHQHRRMKSKDSVNSFTVMLKTSCWFWSRVLINQCSENVLWCVIGIRISSGYCSLSSNLVKCLLISNNYENIYVKCILTYFVPYQHNKFINFAVI